MYIGVHVKYRLFWADVNKTCIFSIHFRLLQEYKILLKSLQQEKSCSVWTDGRDEAKTRS